MSVKKFLCSPQYRREVIFQRPFKGFCKKSEGERVKKRTIDTRMQLEGDGYLSKIKDFPSVESVAKLKDVVHGVEIKLRDGGIVNDYSGAVNGGLKAWGTGKTAAQTANVLVETALGTHALGEAIVEWKKRQYFCCICIGIACSCFYVGAVSSLIPGGYGVWKGASKAGPVAKSVTGVCRKVTGGHGF